MQADALIEQSDPFFVSRQGRFALLAASHGIATIYEGRPFAEAGGLVSYGPSLPGVYHQVGAYVGRLLKGAKSGELPVMQPTKLELIFNLIAAKGDWTEHPGTIAAARPRGDSSSAAVST